MSYRCCNGDPRGLSESPHFTHPPPLLHGYETGTGFFVWFFFHSSFGNQTSAVKTFAGMPFQRGSAAGCRWRWQSHKGAIAAGRVAWLEGAPCTRGAQPGWPLGECAQPRYPRGKGNLESQAETRLLLLPSPRQTITASLALPNAKYRPHNTWSVPLPLLPPPPPQLRAGMAHALAQSLGVTFHIKSSTHTYDC